MRLLLLLGVLASGCTCLTRFDPNSQPCELGAPVGEQCLAGYECVEQTADAGVCRRVDAGP